VRLERRFAARSFLCLIRGAAPNVPRRLISLASLLAQRPGPAVRLAAQSHLSGFF